MEYAHLDKGEIRILHLLPDENRDTDIWCNISQGRLKPRSYAALGEPESAGSQNLGRWKASSRYLKSIFCSQKFTAKGLES
jgi:hypothetical protein